MLNKIEKSLLAVYFGICGFFRDLMNDEKGISGTVVAVLLILVAVLAVLLIWGFLSGWIKETWETLIKGNAEKIKLN